MSPTSRGPTPSRSTTEVTTRIEGSSRRRRREESRCATFGGHLRDVSKWRAELVYVRYGRERRNYLASGTGSKRSS